MLACDHGTDALWWVLVGSHDVVRLPTIQKEAIHSPLSFPGWLYYVRVETSWSEAEQRWRIPGMSQKVVCLQCLLWGCQVGLGGLEPRGWREVVLLTSATWENAPFFLP